MAHTEQQAPAATRDEEPRRGGFGLNSLIGRMTGHGQEAERPAPQPVRGQPTMHAVQPEAEEDQERIEIPAFLRRQAN